MTFDKKKYDAEYRRKNLDTVSFMLPKGKRALLKKTAGEKGITMTRLIIDALETTYQLDLSNGAE